MKPSFLIISHENGKLRLKICFYVYTSHYDCHGNNFHWCHHMKKCKPVIVTIQQKQLSHRRGGVLCLHWAWLLHLAGGLCLRLQGCKRQGGFRGCANGQRKAREATGYVCWCGGGATCRDWGRRLQRNLLLLCRNMVVVLLLLWSLQAGRGIGWWSGTQWGLRCRATGQLGAKWSQCI